MASEGAAKLALPGNGPGAEHSQTPSSSRDDSLLSCAPARQKRSKCFQIENLNVRFRRGFSDRGALRVRKILLYTGPKLSASPAHQSRFAVRGSFWSDGFRGRSVFSLSSKFFKVKKASLGKETRTANRKLQAFPHSQKTRHPNREPRSAALRPKKKGAGRKKGNRSHQPRSQTPSHI